MWLICTVLQTKNSTAFLSSRTEIFPRSIPTNCCLFSLQVFFRVASKKKKTSRLAPAAKVLTHDIHRVGGFPPQIRPNDTRRWWRGGRAGRKNINHHICSRGKSPASRAKSDWLTERVPRAPGLLPTPLRKPSGKSVKLKEHPDSCPGVRGSAPS